MMHRHCHKWALLLTERKQKLNEAKAAIETGDFESAKRLSNQIFNGKFGGKQADPGMAGSLLYHMAMVTKMESETRILLKELQVAQPDITKNLDRFYGDFILDAKELMHDVTPFTFEDSSLTAQRLGTEQKIALFSKLKKAYQAVEKLLNSKDTQASTALEDLFNDWASQVIIMRLIQEIETIKGLLTLAKLTESVGVAKVQKAMDNVKDRFGQETVSIALDVTLKVGMRREKLQSVMLSDHYINYTMATETLDGHMEFLNCPIHGGHHYIMKDLGISSEVATLFCKNFCFAHAKAMLRNCYAFSINALATKTYGKRRRM